MLHPFILFELTPIGSDTQLIQIRLNPTFFSDHFTSHSEFKRLYQSITDAAGIDRDYEEWGALPLGNELRGRWTCSSPMGKESSCPPAYWEFDQRIKLALTLTDTHPLFSAIVNRHNMTIDEFLNPFLDLFRKQYGDESITGVVQKKAPSFLDYDWGYDGGTC